MNTENSKTSEQHRFKSDLTDKLNLKILRKTWLQPFWVFVTPGKTSSQNITTTWNDTFDLPDGSYSIVDIQDCFEFIIEKHETLTENSPVPIYPNRIKNRIAFKVKAGYKLELLTPETMKLLGSTKKRR